MTNAFIVVGDNDTGKSSVVRCLTGVAKQTTYEVAVTNPRGRIDLTVKVSSLQESDKTPQWAINEFSGKENVLLALWRSAKNQRYPDANAYLTAFRSAGWQFEAIAVLDSAPFTPSVRFQKLVSVIPMSSRHWVPANEMARTIRRSWNWV